MVSFTAPLPPQGAAGLWDLFHELRSAAVAAPARATHTGTQPSSTISDFTEAVQDAVAALLGAGSNVVVNYDDAANSLTISTTGNGGAGLDPEQVRDVIGVAIVGLGPVAVTVNDAADTITITTTATVNSTDAALRARSTHTGTQAASTITGLAAVATTGAYADLTGAPPTPRAIHPEAHGVIGDGVTDNTAAWPAVLAAAAAANLPIYLAPDKAYAGRIQVVDQSLSLYGGGRLIVPASKTTGGLSVLHTPGPAVAVSDVSALVVGPVTGKPSPPQTETTTALTVARSDLARFKADDVWRIQAPETYEWSTNPGIPAPQKVWKAAMVPIAGTLFPFTAGAAAIKENDTVTGAASGATALVGSVDGAGAFIAKWTTGVFTANEAITVDGSAAGSLTGTPVVLAKGLLDDTYMTGVSVRKLRSDLRVSIRDITIDTAADPDTLVGTANRPAAVSLLGCVDPEVTGVTIRNAWATGLLLASCMRPSVRLRVTRSANNATTGGTASNAPSEQGYGYGIELLGSTEHADITVRASTLRHAITTNPTCYNTRPVAGVAGASENSELLLGTVKRNVVHDSLASGTWAAGFDTHDGAYHTMFRDCVAIGAQAASRYFSESAGFQNRAFNTTFENCRSYGGGRGFVDLTGIDNTNVTSVARYLGCFAEDYQYIGFEIRNAAISAAKRLEMDSCRARGKALGTSPYASVGFSVAFVDAVIRDCVSERFSLAPLQIAGGSRTYASSVVVDSFTADYSEVTTSASGVRIGGITGQSVTLVGPVRVLANDGVVPASAVYITGGSPLVRFTDDPLVVNADQAVIRKVAAVAGATPTIKRVPGFLRPVEWTPTAPTQPLTNDVWGDPTGGGVSIWNGIAWESATPATVTSVAGRTGTVTLTGGDVGLGAVDNTADVDKPLSSPQAAALAAFGTRYQQVWRPGTAYTSGNVVVSPTGRLVAAKATFTSGAGYDAANWTVISDASYLLRPTAAGSAGQVPTLTADGTLAYTTVGARVVVEHGAVSNVIRPTTSGPVTWIGSVRPQNWIDGDDWYEASPTTTPDLPTTNLVNYWRASDLSMVQGDPVTTLANRVSGGPALTATGGPVFDTESGTASVLLDGVDDHLSETTTSLAQPSTLVFVARMVTAAASKALVSAASTVHAVSSTSASKWSVNAGTSLAHSGSIDTGWHVIAAVFNGASTIIYVDGVAVTGAGGANARTGTRVGANSGLTAFTNMKIAAVAQYATAMTVADLDGLRITLKQRYPVLP